VNQQQENRLRKDIADGWKNWVIAKRHQITEAEVKQWRYKIRMDRVRLRKAEQQEQWQLKMTRLGLLA